LLFFELAFGQFEECCKRTKIANQYLGRVGAYPQNLYWLLGTSVQEKTDLACPITIIPGHGTRLRDKGNLFFSLSERGKLK